MEAAVAPSLVADHELAARFGRLQEKMASIHAAMRAKHGRRCMVVVPSRSIDRWREPPAETQAYEERLLCLLLMLRDPGLSLVYVTSSPIAPAIVDYYLSQLPSAVLRRDARTRLTLLSAQDGSARPLTEKLLERPRLMTQIRWSVPDRELGYLVPYMTTALERDLALALDLPVYGADPCHQDLGTKSGSRELFARAGVPHPLGIKRITGGRAAIEAIARLRAARPGLVEVLVKLDDAVSGEGNAVVDLRELPLPGADHERQRIAERLDRMAPEATGVSVEAYMRVLAARGGVVEERIRGRELCSPSVQLEVTPVGEVEIVSTHDQVLGGAGGQSYHGCRFPAAPSYSAAITDLARTVGHRLAGAGVIGRSAVDFVVVRDDGGRWHPYAVEINLRSGGTTHSFAALESLTGGAYHARTATFTTAAGAQKHYVATDHLADPSLRALGRDGLLGLRRLGFDHARQRGVVFHMLSSLNELGLVGLTAIGDDPLDAQRCYDRARAVVLEEARCGSTHLGGLSGRAGREDDRVLP
jgi:hypothetical protein